MALLLLGDNSGKIIYSAGEPLENILTDITTFLTTHGWELWDDQIGSYYRVFRAPTLSGTPYKYLNVSLATAGYCITSVYEDWDNTTHTGTNVAYYSTDTNHSQKVDITNGGELYIFATENYAIFFSYLPVSNIWGNNSNFPSGVVDFYVVNPTIGNDWCHFIWFSGFDRLSYRTSPRTPEGVGSVGDIIQCTFRGGWYRGANRPNYYNYVNPYTDKSDIIPIFFVGRFNDYFIGYAPSLLLSLSSTLGGHLDEVTTQYDPVSKTISPNGGTTTFLVLNLQYVSLLVLK